jgi:hypothetical protein
MSKAKFEAAKELIQERKFDEARAILKTVEHPTANKWLKKLDEIDPPFPDVPTSEGNPPYKVTSQNKRDKRKLMSDDAETTQKPEKAHGKLMLGIVVTFLVVVLIGVAMFISSLQRSSAIGGGEAMVWIECGFTDECYEIADWLVENMPDELIRCYHDDAISRCIGMYYYETGWEPPQ